MRRIVFLCCLFHQGFWAQSVESADALFDRFEYLSSIKAYEQLSLRQKLTLKQYKNLSYATFTLGDFERSFALTDSIMKTANAESFFEYAHGYSAFATGKYAQAERSLRNYKLREKNKDLDSLLTAIMFIDTWKKLPKEGLKLDPNNTLKAESTQDIWKKKVLVLIESGINKRLKTDLQKDLSQSEFLFKYPHVIEQNGKRNTLQFVSLPIDYPTFNSISISENNVVVCNVSGYSNKGEYFKPTNYIGSMVNDTLVGSLRVFLPSDTLFSNSISINNAGNQIVFSARTKDKEDADIYRVTKTNETWNAPKLANELSSPGNDVYPIFLSDSTISFSSDGRMGYGGLDLYHCTITSSKQGFIEHYSSPINGPSDDFGLLQITADSAWFTSNRFAGIGDDDVYSYTQLSQKATITQDTTDSTSDSTTISSIKNLIFSFDFDSYSLKNIPDTLNQFIAFFNAHEDYELIIVGRTDQVGSEDYNAYLGEMRAKSVAKYLVAKGISTAKIKVISKGEKDPVVRCKPCGPEANARNRIVNIDVVRP